MARCSRHGSRWWLRRARRCLLSAGERRAGHAGAAGNHAGRAGGWGTAAHERIPRRIAAGGVWGTHTTTRSAGSGRAAKRRLLVQPRRRWPAVAAVVAVGSPRGGLWHDRRAPVVGRGGRGGVRRVARPPRARRIGARAAGSAGRGARHARLVGGTPPGGNSPVRGNRWLAPHLAGEWRVSWGVSGGGGSRGGRRGRGVSC